MQQDTRWANYLVGRHTFWGCLLTITTVNISCTRHLNIPSITGPCVKEIWLDIPLILPWALLNYLLCTCNPTDADLHYIWPHGQPGWKTLHKTEDSGPSVYSCLNALACSFLLFCTANHNVWNLFCFTLRRWGLCSWRQQFHSTVNTV